MVMKVVDEAGLEAATSEGWTLAATHISESVEDLAEVDHVVVPPLPGQEYQGHKIVPMSKMCQKVVRSLRFVLKLSDESELARKTERMKELERLKAEMVAKNNTLAAEWSKEEKLRLDLANILKGREEELSRVRGMMESSRKKAELYETDMAKLRTEFGEAAMKKVLGR